MNTFSESSLQTLLPALSDRKTVIQIFGIACLYFLTARLGFFFPFDGELATLYWPSTGFSLAVLLLLGLDRWLGITIGAVLIALSNRHSLNLTIAITLTHTLEALVGAYLLKRYFALDYHFERTKDVLSFVVIGAFLSAAIGATLAVASFAISPEGQSMVVAVRWWHWWVGHVISILTLTPVILIWYSNRQFGWRGWQMVDLCMSVGLLLAVTVTVFIHIVDFPIGNYPLGHVVFPFLLWIALRFTPREVATAGLAVCVIAVIGTINGTGPFSRPNLDLNLLLLFTFVFSVISMALLISTILTQRRHAREGLEQANMQLEQRVGVRTNELSVANVNLQQKIMELQETESQLQYARDQALDALRLKAQILANVSHDARTPLNIIMLHTELYQRKFGDSLTPKQIEMLKTIALSSQELLGFVDNLLDEARLQTDKVEADWQRTNLHNLIPEMTAMHQPIAERSGLELIVEVDSHVPESIYTDTGWIKQIHDNLVGNALKFTKEGRVSVYVMMLDDAQWQLQVSDTGVGIPVDAQESIFDAFWQVDGSMTREVSRGVGLGLSIVRQLSFLMDGKVKVESEAGKGSTFTVTFPLLQQGELSSV